MSASTAARRIALTFNPHNDQNVQHIKECILVDLDTLISAELDAKLVGNEEAVRCFVIAQERLEEACTWAVKGFMK